MLKMESVIEARPLTAPWYVIPKKPAAVPIACRHHRGEETARERQPT